MEGRQWSIVHCSGMLLREHDPSHGGRRDQRVEQVISRGMRRMRGSAIRTAPTLALDALTFDALTVDVESHALVMVSRANRFASGSRPSEGMVVGFEGYVSRDPDRSQEE